MSVRREKNLVNDKDFYRIIRYFTVLTFEHYEIQRMWSEKFNLPLPKKMTLEDIMQHICEDFGLPYDAVLEYSKLEGKAGEV